MLRKSARTVRFRVIVNVVLLVVFLACTISGLFLIRGMFLKQTNETYTLLVQNYAEREEARIDLYTTLLELSTDFVASMEEHGASTEQISNALFEFLKGYDQVYENVRSQTFGVINDTFISDAPGFDPSEHHFDYTGEFWYEAAMSNEGAVASTDAYRDYLTGEQCITLFQGIPGTKDMLAFDIFISGHAEDDENTNLPEDCSFYLLDARLQVIAMETPLPVAREEAQKVLGDVIGSASPRTTFVVENITTPVSSDRNAYVERLKNGWYAVLTVPGSYVVQQMMPFYIVIAVVSLIWGLIIVGYTLRNYRVEKKQLALLDEREFIERDRDIIEKTTQSTLAAYKELAYIDLVNDHMQVIYADDENFRRGAVFTSALKAYLEEHDIVDTDVINLSEVLSIDGIRRVLTDKDYMEARFRISNEDGSRETFLVSVAIIERENGVPTSVALSLRSMENILQAERNRRVVLKSAAEQAEAASQAKTEFLSQMSHDMRTPLNAIKGMTSIALMDLDNRDNVRESLEKIDASSAHLLELINSILDISKIESGRMVLAEGPFRLDDLLGEIYDMFETTALQKSIRFTVAKEDGLVDDDDVVGDKKRLRELLANIVGNAMKFTPDGGEVSVSVIERKELVNGRKRFVFKINDTGIGMSEDFLQHLFEPFTRENAEGTDEIEGTGLGMSIALNIARLMGGDIEVTSEPGVGTKFRVAVYLGVSGSTSSDNDGKSAKDDVDSFRECNFAGRRALVVDDVEINSEIAMALLGSVGISCDSAGNGQEALDRLVAEAPGTYDIVFMDIQMPVMDGHRAAQAIRVAADELGRPDLAELPIFAMTANAFAEDTRKAKAAGMNGHIAKPLDLKELKAVLQANL